MTSTGLTLSSLGSRFLRRSSHTVLSSTVNFLRFSEICLRFSPEFSLGFSVMGTVGFNKSKPLLLSTTVRAAWSITRLLCERKGKPSIRGAHKLGATMARTVRDVHREDGSCKGNFTYSVSWNTFFSSPG